MSADIASAGHHPSGASGQVEREAMLVADLEVGGHDLASVDGHSDRHRRLLEALVNHVEREVALLHHDRRLGAVAPASAHQQGERKPGGLKHLPHKPPRIDTPDLPLTPATCRSSTRVTHFYIVRMAGRVTHGVTSVQLAEITLTADSDRDVARQPKTSTQGTYEVLLSGGGEVAVADFRL